MTAGKQGSGEAGKNAVSAPHGVRQARVRLVLLTILAGIGGIWGLKYHQEEQVLETTPVRELTGASVAQRVRAARGKVLILALYRPNSEDPHEVGDLRRWALQTTTPKVEILAVAAGSKRDAQHLFLYGMELGIERLPPEWLAPEHPGVLDSTMSALGMDTDHSKLPVVAVFDRSGHVTAQWSGNLDYAPVLAAAKAARQQS
jgi:hypothetical protein